MNKAKVNSWVAHHHIFVIFIAIVILIFVLNVGVGHKASAPTPVNEPASSNLPADGDFLTIAGEFVCLPHKDTTGPQTEECAFGLKSEDTYYALQDSTADSSLVSKAVTGQDVRVGGTFKARSDSNYKDIGVITVTSLEPLETPPPATP